MRSYIKIVNIKVKYQTLEVYHIKDYCNVGNKLVSLTTSDHKRIYYNLVRLCSIDRLRYFTTDFSKINITKNYIYNINNILFAIQNL